MCSIILSAISISLSDNEINYSFECMFSDPAAGFRQAMYTLVGLVVALLVLLLICIVLLKRKVKERKGHLGSYH